MTTLCTTKETDFLNILDYSDPSQPIGKTVPIALARAAPKLLEALKALLNDYQCHEHSAYCELGIENHLEADALAAITEAEGR